MGSDPLDNLPVDEDVLSALIEGEMGTGEADEVRERLLAADPRVAATIEMMERDRVILRSMGDESPPAGLPEAIVARLEREALAGLSEGDGPIPISTVHTSRARGGVGRWLTSPAGAGLAMAAVLAIAAGITLQFVGGPPQTMPERDIALNDDDPVDPEGVGESTPVTRIASDVPERPEMLADVGEPDAPEPDPSMLFTDDFERALALVHEGRLLVRVRSVSPDETVAGLNRLTERRRVAGEMWRMTDEVGSPVMLAMETHFQRPSVDEAPFAIASEEGQPAVARQHGRERRSALEGVYVADTRLEASALAALRSSMSLGDGQVAVFEELAEPLEVRPVLTAESVLWWSRPPKDWARRAHVPIVVERMAE